MITMKMNPGAVARITGLARRIEVAANTMPEIIARAVVAVLEGGDSFQESLTAGTGQRSSKSLPWFHDHMITVAIDIGGLDEKWPENAEYTKKQKGHSIILKGKSGEMENSFVVEIRQVSNGVQVWLSNTADDDRWSKNWKGFDNPHEGWNAIPSRKLGYIGDTELAQIAENLAKYLRQTLHRQVTAQT